MNVATALYLPRANIPLGHSFQPFLGKEEGKEKEEEEGKEEEGGRETWEKDTTIMSLELYSHGVSPHMVSSFIMPHTPRHTLKAYLDNIVAISRATVLHSLRALDSPVILSILSPAPRLSLACPSPASHLGEQELVLPRGVAANHDLVRVRDRTSLHLTRECQTGDDLVLNPERNLELVVALLFQRHGRL